MPKNILEIPSPSQILQMLAARRKLKAEDKSLEAPGFDPVTGLAMLLGGPTEFLEQPLENLIGKGLLGSLDPSVLIDSKAPKISKKSAPTILETPSSSTDKLDPATGQLKPRRTQNFNTPTEHFDQADPEEILGPEEYHYLHGVGPGRTGPVDRVENYTKSIKPKSANGRVWPTTNLWEDPRIQPISKTLTNNLPGADTSNLIDPKYQQFIEPIPAETAVPNNLLYHGLGLQGDPQAEMDTLRAIQKHGLKGGWFSENPAQVAEGEGGLFLGVEPKNLPKLITQRRMYSEDPPVEIIPDWLKRSGRAVSIPNDYEAARARLSRMGALNIKQQAEAVDPENIYIVDSLMRILGKLAKGPK